MICHYILYNTILDGKEIDIEILMTQLDLENFVNYVHQAYRNHQERNAEELTNDNDIEAEILPSLEFLGID